MSSLIFLCHRIPFPPNKGEKIRAYRFLQHLARDHAVRLACFVDDPEDAKGVESLAPLCSEIRAINLSPRLAPLRAARGLFRGEPLSVSSFWHPEMARWLRGSLEREPADIVFAYSSAMAQYVMARDVLQLLPRARLIMDFVDVDSDKWKQYAETARAPMRWIYARGAYRLLAFDRSVAARFDANVLVSEPEASLFRRLAPESAAKTCAVGNGVDNDFFSPNHRFASPYGSGHPRFVFTGTMNYRPNVDAVVWFAKEILPLVREALPHAIFIVVGAKPTTEVRELSALEGVTVTGGVDDVRPYMAHADVIVAPLRMARGVQNKVLEGMAMAKPVVTTAKGLEGITAEPGKHVLIADTALGFAAAAVEASGARAREIGDEARRLIEASLSWEHQLAALDAVFAARSRA